MYESQFATKNRHINKKRRLFVSSTAYDRKHSAGAKGPIINPAADDMYSIADAGYKKQPLFEPTPKS